MCGIAGFSLKQAPDDAQGLGQKLAYAMAHRGPDGEGFFFDAGVGLVHRRLSIIDPEGGAQPLYHADQTRALVANGEIYNYKQLQMACKAMGATLATGSDCEPLLHIYNADDPHWVRQLQGMFAFAIYDKTQDQLVLGRDPFGIKPLYFVENENGFYFASEPGVLVRAGVVAPQLNAAQVMPLLCRQYTTGRETLFAGVQRALPGEILVVKSGEIISRQRFLPQLNAPEENDAEKAEEQFSNRFAATVESHLQSDVPYGAFLSGGIDSSSVVWQMQQLVGKVRTFTIGFDSDTVPDERPQAEKLTKELKTDHTGVLFSQKDFWHYLPQMAQALDDLVADYAALPLLKLAERAKDDVKVILSGEGGDEVFAGYSRYRRRRGLWARLTGGLGLRGKGDGAYFKKMWQPYVVNHAPKMPENPYDTDGWTLLQKRQAADIQDWLPDDLLTKVDRCLMFHGVEGRVPFLDTHFAAWGFALPDSLKLQGKTGKWLVKNWLNKKAPYLNVFAKKKGFTVPVADFLEQEHAFVSQFLMENAGIAQIAKLDQLAQFLAQPFQGKRAKLVFTLLIFALWYNTHIVGDPKQQKWMEK